MLYVVHRRVSTSGSSASGASRSLCCSAGPSPPARAIPDPRGLARLLAGARGAFGNVCGSREAHALGDGGPRRSRRRVTVHVGDPRASLLLSSLLFHGGSRTIRPAFASTKLGRDIRRLGLRLVYRHRQRATTEHPRARAALRFLRTLPDADAAVAWLFGGSDRALWQPDRALVHVLLPGHCVLQPPQREDIGDREIARRRLLTVAVFPSILLSTQVYAESPLSPDEVSA